MKVFISLNIAGPKELLLHQQLVQELKALGVTVITNLDLKKGNFDGTGFESLDAVIVDGSSEIAETGYLLAIALAHKKQVLYLLRKGTLLDASVEALTKNAEVKKHLKISFYVPDTLVRKVKDFLQYLDSNLGKESYSIKYTLRLSPRLDRYFSWKAGKENKNKADFLRDWVDKLSQEDEEYKNRLK